MKQGATLTKIIFVMLLLALIAYGISAAVSNVGDRYTTVAAIAYEVGDGFQATGFVVRDEKVLPAPSGINVLLCDEGARVAKGEPLAANFIDTDAQKAQLRIDEITAELEQLNTVLQTLPEAQGSGTLDEAIHQQLQRLYAHNARGNLRSAADDGAELKTMLLQRFLDDAGRKAMQEKSQSLKEELATLRTRLSGAVTQTIAENAGFFSSSTDGYESLLSAKTMLSLSPSQLDALSQKEPQGDGNALGRLITSAHWFFLCSARQEELAHLHTGDRIQAEFAFDPSQTLSMQVVRLSEPEDGRQTLVLSCTDHMGDIACLRTQTADIVLHGYSGIRIPKKALRYENNAGGVYILEGAVAVWKPVKIVYEAADYFIVQQDKTDTDNLWPGDEIIITTGELSEGKVIE